MAKIAIIDLSFTWPPDGGARTDIREIAIRLAKTHSVRMFVPDILGWMKLGSHWIQKPLDQTRFFWKGKVTDDVGIPITHVPFGPLSFGKKSIGKYFQEFVSAWNPDHVFIADGWYLKPYVVHALKDYKPVVRIYAHEMLCLKGNGFFYKWGKPCYHDYLQQGFCMHMRCNICTSAFYLKYPSPTWIHEYITSGAMFPKYVHAVKQAFEFARCNIVYNEFTASRIRPYSSNVKIVPSGVNVKAFEKLSQQTCQSKPKKIILALGRMEEPRKGFQVLLRATTMLHRKRQDFEIWVTGTKRYSQPWVRSLGWISHEKLPPLFYQVDMVVVPSVWPEPHGIVAIEAMACEKPVILSRIGGLAEICTDQKDGITFDPDNAFDLAAKIEGLLDNPSLCEQLGKEAKITVQNKYDWDIIVEQHVAPLFDN